MCRSPLTGASVRQKLISCRQVLMPPLNWNKFFSRFFVRLRKVPLPLEQKVDQTFDELFSLGILDSIEASGVENISPVVSVRKSDKLRRCGNYRVHVIGKSNNEAYPSRHWNYFLKKFSW